MRHKFQCCDVTRRKGTIQKMFSWTVPPRNVIYVRKFWLLQKFKWTCSIMETNYIMKKKNTLLHNEKNVVLYWKNLICLQCSQANWKENSSPLVLKNWRQIRKVLETSVIQLHFHLFAFSSSSLVYTLNETCYLFPQIRFLQITNAWGNSLFYPF